MPVDVDRVGRGRMCILHNKFLKLQSCRPIFQPCNSNTAMVVKCRTMVVIFFKRLFQVKRLPSSSHSAITPLLLWSTHFATHSSS